MFSTTATIRVSHIFEKEEWKREKWTNAIQRSILKVLRNKNYLFYFALQKISVFFFAIKLLKAENVDNNNNGLQVNCNNAIDSRWNVWILWLSAIDSFLFFVCVLILENYFSVLSVRSVSKIPILSCYCWSEFVAHSRGLLLIFVVSCLIFCVFFVS